MKNIIRGRRSNFAKVYGRLFEQEEEKSDDAPSDDAASDDSGDDADDSSDSGDLSSGGGGFSSSGGGGGGSSSAPPADDSSSSDAPPNDEKEDTKIAVSAEDEARLQDSIDSELEAVIGKFETDARKTAAIETNDKGGVSESRSLKRVYRKLLKEVAASDIDLKKFAADLSRLVNNYDNLLDMESIILNKGYSYIQQKYGEETVKALKDVLEQDFGIDVDRNAIEKDEPEIPVAVGARDSGGGGGV